MSDTDQVSATGELRDLRDCVAKVAVPARPALEVITARGRARRRHRRFTLAGLSVAGASAAAALVLGLTGVPGAAPAPGTNHTVALGANPTAVPVRIQTAAFTIVSNRDGTVSLTINPKELFDSTRLQRDLAKYGIPALVTTGSFCSSDPAPAGLSHVMSYQPGKNATVTIDPAAMPAGAELSLGTLALKDGVVRASFTALINKSAYSCTDSPPTEAGGQSTHVTFFELGPTVKGTVVQRDHAGS